MPARKLISKSSMTRARITPIRPSTATIASHELYLYTKNDGDIYRQRRQAVEKNLERKIEKGQYDPKRATVAFEYVTADGAKKYDKEFGSPGTSSFTKEDRRKAAEELQEDFEKEQALKNPK